MVADGRSWRKHGYRGEKGTRRREAHARAVRAPATRAFYDPEFQNVERQIGEVIDVAWEACRSVRQERGRGAKTLELEEWEYPRHLAGRVFSVVVHGDTVGAETLRRSLTDWLTDMKLLPAMPQGGIDHYIGYDEPVRDEP